MGVVDSLHLVDDRMQVVNHLQRVQKTQLVQRKNAGGRKLQKQQMKRRKRENAKKQLAKTPREKASETEKKNKNK